jgi:uncharacterized integral membrane protein
VLFLIFLLFFLLCGGLVVLTVFNFATQVHLTVASWQSPDLPIGFWMILAFVLGAILFYLFTLASARSDRREMKRLQKQVSALEQEKAAASVAAAPVQNAAPASMSANVSTSSAHPTGPLMPMPGTSPVPQSSQRGDLPPQNFRQ